MAAPVPRRLSLQLDGHGMPVTEHTINDALAEELKKSRHAWHQDGIVRSENTGMLRGSNRRPDLLVNEPNVSPVVIETEVLPAVTVEAEAKERLGERLRTTGRTILSAIAVRLPVRLRATRSAATLKRELAAADDLEIALYTGSDQASASRCLQPDGKTIFVASQKAECILYRFRRPRSLHPLPKAVQLGMAYEPDPPFKAGSPTSAGPELTKVIRLMFAPLSKPAMAAAERAKARW